MLYPRGGHERGAAPADDDRRCAERPGRGDRRHVRRLPGPRQGDVQRRGVPRAAQPDGRQLDQLGAGDGPDRLLRDCRPALRGPITACVPTGNFGNIFAGWVAQRMGAPIADFIVASNANDILTRFVNDGDMSIRPVVATTSPSMDIQVSSNFERLLFEMNERDGLRTAEQLARFRQSGSARARLPSCASGGSTGLPAGRSTTPRSPPRCAASTRRPGC